MSQAQLEQVLASAMRCTFAAPSKVEALNFDTIGRKTKVAAPTQKAIPNDRFHWLLQPRQKANHAHRHRTGFAITWNMQDRQDLVTFNMFADLNTRPR